MSYCANGKMWCLPSDLLTFELEDMINLLWLTFTFENGDDIVQKMIERCEHELHNRKTLKTSRNLVNWSHIGWPKDGVPVIEYDFNKHEATVVRFNSPLRKWLKNSSSQLPKRTSKFSGLADLALVGNTGTNTRTA